MFRVERHSIMRFSARQQNRVGGAFDTRAHGRDGVDAGRAESTPGSDRFLALTRQTVVHATYRS